MAKEKTTVMMRVDGADPVDMRVAAVDQIRGVLDRNWPEIWTAMKESYAEFDRAEGKTFSYKVGLGVCIEPASGDFLISASLAWAVKHKDESVGAKVSDQPDMFDQKAGE